MVPRRTVLAVAAATPLAAAVPTAATAAPRATSPGRIAYPFTLGVASGDPTPDGVVLWTRLAVDPLAEDGRGGMPDRPWPVEWQVARDPQFRRVVRSGRGSARPATAHSVHVEVDGLEPGREHWYRFRSGPHLSPVGRTLTAPPRGASGALTIAVASCSQYEHGFFTAYRRLAQDQPDLVLHLGDYIYEYRADDYLAPGGNVRDHAGPETVTLADYRRRHAQYRSDPDLQAAHAVAPWLVTWDDHEVDNNWADEVPEDDQSRPDFLARRAAAFQAYYENMPLRRSSVPRGIDLQLFRRVEWGDLATFHVLDTRQYRDDQACGDGIRAGCAERLDPERSITGREQEDWLLDGLARSRGTWDVLAQQVFFAESDYVPGADELYNMDAWDGYVASRDRILRGMVERDVENPVVLTGDIHSSWANELKTDFRDPASATVGVELVTTSITSGGDGNDVPFYAGGVRAENPHVRHASDRRGYLLARLSPERLEADFRELPYVQQPGAPVTTRRSFVVEAGDPGLRDA